MLLLFVPQQTYAPACVHLFGHAYGCPCTGLKACHHLTQNACGHQCFKNKSHRSPLSITKYCGKYQWTSEALYMQLFLGIAAMGRVVWGLAVMRTVRDKEQSVEETFLRRILKC